MPIIIAKANRIDGWREMGHARIEQAAPGRAERWYYYNPQWPYALHVCQGARIESYMGCQAILCLTTNGFGDSVAPRWVSGVSEVSAVSTMDISREGDPAHWRAGYYKVTMFPASTARDFEACRLTLSQVLDQLQAEAVGPMMAIMAHDPQFPEGASDAVVAALKVAFDGACSLYGRPDMTELAEDMLRKSHVNLNNPRHKYLRLVKGHEDD